MTPPSAPPGGAWTDLGDGVRVRQSRAWAMNSVVLAQGGHALLVDPGVLPSELDDLARATRDVAPGAVTLFFTHGDWDHVLGRPWWPGARSIGHDGLAGELRGRREAILAEARATAEGAGETWTRGFEPFRPDLEASGLHVAQAGPWHLVLRDARGHSATMLSLHLPQLRVLIAGDMLSDIEIPTLTESAAGYRRALADLLPIAEHGAITCLVPGHGAIARGTEEAVARIRADLAYLETLEHDVRDSLAAGLSREQALVRVERIDHPAKAAPGMPDAHRRNVAIVYDEAAAHRGGRRASGRTAVPRA